MRRLLLFVALAGCAKAGPTGLVTHDDAMPRPDSNDMHPPLDAFVSHVDAPPGQQVKTLDENTSDTLAPGVGIACPSGDPFGDTAAASYLRVFDLTHFNITGDFHVSQVSFQVDDDETFSGNGSIVAVTVGTYTGATGTTLTGTPTPLASDTNVAVPEVVSGGAGATVNVPLTATIPSGGKLYVDIDSDDGTFDHSFYLGANSAGESASSYILMQDCSIGPPPASIASVYTAHAVDLLITVTGSY